MSVLGWLEIASHVTRAIGYVVFAFLLARNWQRGDIQRATFFGVLALLMVAV